MIKRSRPWVKSCLAIGVGAALSLMALAPVSAANSQVPRGTSPSLHHSKQWLIQVTFTNGGPFGTTGIIGTAQGVPWTEANFKKWASEGITGVEMNMNWQAMEPSPGVYDFSQVQQYAQDAHEAGLTFIPIFWESMWHPGNPPSWLKYTPEMSSTGQEDNWPITVYVGSGPAPSGLIPAMWSQRALSAYQQFVTAAFQALSSSPGFGGAYVDAGWLDAGYGPTPSGTGIEGYAAPDVSRYHLWLQQQYGTIANLNQDLDTTYSSFNAVPAFTPGEPHFDVYQKFRAWSYKAIMSQIYSSIRQVSQKPIYLYFGGNMTTAGEFMNLPDIDFQLAQKFKAIVNLDTAGHLGFAQLFGYLSQAYHVPLLEEWTPTGLIPQDIGIMAQWMGHVAQEGSYGGGADYFADLGSGHQFNFYAPTFPTYLAQKAVMEQVRGSQPQYPVGIMLGYDQIFADHAGGITGGLGLLGSYLRSARPAANIFSDLSVLDGAVSLSQFHTIIDWNGDLTAPNLNPALKAALEGFQQNGGTIIPGPIEANANAFTLLDQPDGQYRVQTVLGRSAIVSQLGVGGTNAYSQYLYFKVPSSIVSPTQPNVSVQVTYANNQTNAFLLQYDSSNLSAPVNGAYATAYPANTQTPVSVTNTGAYATATFNLTNALFQGAENGGADFRIAIDHPGLAISSVTVSAAGNKATFVPAELSMPSAPASVIVHPNASNIEAYLTEGHGKAWLVASNIGSQPFSGTISIPSSILNTLVPGMPNVTLRSHSLEGTWTSTGVGSWNVSLPVGHLAVLQIQPGS